MRSEATNGTQIGTHCRNEERMNKKPKLGVRSQENQVKRRRKGPWIGGEAQYIVSWLRSLILASEDDEMITQTTRNRCFKWEMGNGEEVMRMKNEEMYCR